MKQDMVGDSTEFQPTIHKLCWSKDALKEQPRLHDYQNLLLLALTRDEAANLIALLATKLARETGERGDYLNVFLVCKND
jgi:hypothetical protein